MSNTMKTIIFVVSLFAFLFFFILANYVLSPNADFIKAVVYITGYIAALYTQALMKYLYTRSVMKKANIISVLPVKTNELREKLIPLVLPVIAVVMPMVGKREVSPENLKSFVYLVILAAIIQVLFLINSRTLKVYVTNKGFAVNGVDLRLELSISFSYTNAAGWYPFERIENYLAYENKVFLYHTYDMGVITFECSEEETRQIKGLLIANSVPERRY